MIWFIFLISLTLAHVYVFLPGIKIRNMRVTRKPTVHDLKDEVVICSIFAFESAYLKEWIDHHLGLDGVHSLLLYDNNETGSEEQNKCIEIIESHPARSRIKRVPWPGREYQAFGNPNLIIPHFSKFQTRSLFLNQVLGRIYQCFIQSLSCSSIQDRACWHGVQHTSPKDVRWMAFIDIDEFMNPQVESGAGLRGILKQARTNGHNLLTMYRPFFGSNGHEYQPRAGVGVREAYTKRQEFHCLGNVENFNKKSIFVLGDVQSANHHHWVTMKRPQEWTLPTSLFLLNHYGCKSRKEFMERRSRVSVSSSRVRTNQWKLFDQNDVEDKSILRHVL